MGCPTDCKASSSFKYLGGFVFVEVGQCGKGGGGSFVSEEFYHLFEVLTVYGVMVVVELWVCIVRLRDYEGFLWQPIRPSVWILLRFGGELDVPISVIGLCPMNQIPCLFGGVNCIFLVGGWTCEW